MPKLLQVNVVANLGSTGRIAEDIGLTVMSAGWDSYIAYGRSARSSRSHLIKIASKKSIYSHVLITRLFDRHGLASARSTRNLINTIKVIKPDIIHLHNIHGYYINYPIFFKFLLDSNIPIVWTLHDCWAFTGHCAYFSYVSCNKWKTGCSHCEQRNKYPSSILIDHSRKNYIEKNNDFVNIKNMVLVPVSDWLCNLLKQSFLQNYSMKRIYNGVNTQIFCPQISKNEIQNKYQVKGDFLILGVANIWEQRKGLNDFIRLSELLPENYAIILVGLSNCQIKNLPSSIVGISRTENAQKLAEIYSAADVFVNPTWEDNFPTTNIEALSCGTPVVTYHTGGSIEAVSPETGLIVSPGDINGLLQAVDSICQNGKSYYTVACRQRALSKFRIEDKYAEYMQLYEKLLNKKYI